MSIVDNTHISLNKFISDSGLCSRREADRLIEQNRVTINGVLARKGNRVTMDDIVLLDGKPFAIQNKKVYIALNKPVGIVCTTDTEEKDNIIDYIKYSERIFPIGRLDKMSQGLILLTNDGDIVNKILRAGNYHEKEYIVEVDKKIDSAFLKTMATGVPILDTVTRPCKIKALSSHVFNITLTQGLNRQIRRMCEYLGYNVIALQRTRIMDIYLDNLPYGHWRILSNDEVTRLQEMVKHSRK